MKVLTENAPALRFLKQELKMNYCICLLLIVGSQKNFGHKSQKFSLGTGR
eukprot:TRINITY_DN12148_c0_g1_i1.p1 TRINITY_DN12148_c0_g1~~TRINITY_DN12148_c0_g1_i1.p1  ORF type:complete len:50 (-),score=6.82 TRINITY_DN12148_c0_g1_i1:397-546(-)